MRVLRLDPSHPLEIIDLIPDFLAHRHGQTTLEEYRRSHKTFFEHYSTYWGGEGTVDPRLTDEEILSRRESILSHLHSAEEKFDQNGLSLQHIGAILFIGNGRANGHAFIGGDQAMAWFALEAFRSEQQMRVFVAHELVHALHYANDPDAYFLTVSEKNTVARQLVTEGIATYVTMQVCDLNEEQSLWADALPRNELDRWMN